MTAGEVESEEHAETGARSGADPQASRRGRKPGPKRQWDERLNVMVPRGLIDELDRRAEKEGITRSALARRLLLDKLRDLEASETQQPSLDTIAAVLRDAPPGLAPDLVREMYTALARGLLQPSQDRRST
ncbi:MAG: hypothetical protein ACRDZO_14230 [Egibacteraceae bacterium]